MPHNSQTKKDKHANQAKEIEHLEAKVKRLEAELHDAQLWIEKYEGVIERTEHYKLENERLQLALAAKDAVLSQFASSDNWQCDTPDWDESFSLWAWAGDDNPLHLANQALSEGKE